MSRKISQAEIATAAGVSISTVSRVLSGAPGISGSVRQSVCQIAESLGYPVDSPSVPVPLTKAIAYLSVGHELAVASVYETVVEGIREGATGADLQLSIALCERMGQLPAHILQDPGVGVFFIGLDPGESTIGQIVAAGIPAVLVNGLDPDLRVDAVAPTNFFGGRLVARHLASLGHHQLLNVTMRQRWTLRRRAEGLAAGVAESATNASDSNVEVMDVPALGETEIFAAMERRLNAGPIDFTAVVCGNDVAAISVIQAIRAHGLRVPDDISVIGFDDIPVASLCDPPLTTVRVDWRLMGREAVRLMLLRRSQPETSALQLQVGTQLIPRATVRRR